MPDIAIGRKEICKALHVSHWDTVRIWKRKRTGFKNIIRRDPGGRPFIIISEARAYLIRYDDLRRKKEKD